MYWFGRRPQLCVCLCCAHSDGFTLCAAACCVLSLTRCTAELYKIPERVSADAHVKGMHNYLTTWEKSVDSVEEFWGNQAMERLSWFAPPKTVMRGSLTNGDVAWFPDGILNVSVNCLDRHPPDRLAIIWEGDEPTDVKHITYGEALGDTCRLANAFKTLGARKGDRICLYMPMVPEAAFCMLACARIGAIHSVVFAGFSAEALRARVIDSECKLMLSADEGLRAKKVIKLKAVVDAALTDPLCDCVTSCLIYKRTGGAVDWKEGRDVWMHEAMAKERPFCAPEPMTGEEPLFLLYTSGSTGKPKGMMHTTAGYLLWASFTHHYTFDYHVGEIYACVADIGWITGHSYIVYGPLANGGTTVMFESLPTYPDAGRYWDLVQRHKINQFYTAPTAIRALMKFGNEPMKKYDLSSLRVLGTVGEPINPEAWRFFFEEVGKGRCVIVDTFWQTETGGHMITNLPGCQPMKPGSASLPMFGVRPVVVDPTSGAPIQGNNVEGVLCVGQPWPGIARSIWGDHGRYMDTYLKPYPGLYFTGDGCKRDKDGYIWITGRVDDVLNVSGHRLGTAEIESALVTHPACVEAAVIGIPHDIKGQGVFAYCILKDGAEETADLIPSLKAAVRAQIGGLATPDMIVCTPGLPKTRSGKIMRRVLRKIACRESDQLGDISTLADPSIVGTLVAKVEALYGAGK
jgi:acetyl-CoA synthetase